MWAAVPFAAILGGILDFAVTQWNPKVFPGAIFVFWILDSLAVGVLLGLTSHALGPLALRDRWSMCTATAAGTVVVWTALALVTASPGIEWVVMLLLGVRVIALPVPILTLAAGWWISGGRTGPSTVQANG